MILFEFLLFLNFVLCIYANVISRKVLEVETRNFYQLVRGSFKKFPDCFHYFNTSCRIQKEITCGER